MVGQALKKNPLPIIFPCHRVIGSRVNCAASAPALRGKRSCSGSKPALFYHDVEDLRFQGAWFPGPLVGHRYRSLAALLRLEAKRLGATGTE